MNERVQVFIACSEKTKNQAQFLASKLEEVSLTNFYIMPVVWLSEANSMFDKFDKLISYTKECDFAIILLNKDDLFMKLANDEREPRDNCVFEAGLFAGAFGPNVKRCFLLVPVDKGMLPSDLKELKFIKISEFTDGNEQDEAKDSLEIAAHKIAEAIREFKKNNELHINRGLKQPIITANELLDLESLRAVGGNLIEGSSIVFVRSESPLETGEEFAQQVIANMVNGSIIYKYLFDKNKNTLGVIADLIAALVKVATIKIRTNEKGEDVYKQLTPNDNINTIKRQLRIYFLPDKPGIHYCIHNANRGPKAICYLKCPDYDSGMDTQFIEWCKGNNADLVSTEVNRLCIDPPKSEKYIFNRSIYCDLYDGTNLDFLSDLETELNDKLEPYGISSTQIKRIFFGKPTKEEAKIYEIVNKVRIIRIFLASSSELEEERNQFDLFFRQKNDDFLRKGVYLEIIRWEKFLDAMSETRLQDEYNQEVRKCDIFISLFFTKTGKFTKEEFETAFKQFKKTGKPRIYTYFKKGEKVDLDSVNTEDVNSLRAFKKKLTDLGHFNTNYVDIKDLQIQFSYQLDILLDKVI